MLTAKAMLIFCVCISSNISTAVLIEQTKTVLVAIGFVNEVVVSFDKKRDLSGIPTFGSDGNEKVKLGSYAVLSRISILADLRIFCANFGSEKMCWC